jgi:hypothetical protein
MPGSSTPRFDGQLYGIPELSVGNYTGQRIVHSHRLAGGGRLWRREICQRRWRKWKPCCYVRKRRPDGTAWPIRTRWTSSTTIGAMSWRFTTSRPLLVPGRGGQSKLLRD